PAGMGPIDGGRLLFRPINWYVTFAFDKLKRGGHMAISKAVYDAIAAANPYHRGDIQVGDDKIGYAGPAAHYPNNTGEVYMETASALTEKEVQTKADIANVGYAVTDVADAGRVQQLASTLSLQWYFNGVPFNITKAIRVSYQYQLN